MSPEELGRIVRYDPDTGLFWAVSSRGRVAKGQRMGCKRQRGIHIRLNGKNYLAHRLVFLMEGVNIDGLVVDHINGDPFDNRRVNLRAVQHRTNNQNQYRPTLGTSLDKRSGRWAANIGSHGKLKFLGYFTTQAEAHAAYLEAKKIIHAEGFVPSRVVAS